MSVLNRERDALAGFENCDRFRWWRLASATAPLDDGLQETCDTRPSRVLPARGSKSDEWKRPPRERAKGVANTTIGRYAPRPPPSSTAAGSVKVAALNQGRRVTRAARGPLIASSIKSNVTRSPTAKSLNRAPSATSLR